MKGGHTIHERYELIELLGKGGMAEVWRARDARLERSVAVKLLSPALAGDASNLARFFREAQSVARISHPNVVTVLDFGQEEQRPYVVMEYAPGGSLADVVGTPMEAPRARDVVTKVAAGAGAAHALGIVHRDVKPANVLLDEQRNPKLADFGIASAAGAERLTATGTTVGSPHYISPEQATGSNASPASDVYSLGVVLYELLTGRRPFEGEGVMAILLAHVEQQPTAPREHVPDLDPELEALVMRCLSKDPKERFANGADLAAALGGAEVPTAVLVEEGEDRTLVATAAPTTGSATQSTATAPTVGPPRQRSPMVRRALLVSGLVVALVAGILVAAALMGTSPEDRPAPDERPTGSTPAPGGGGAEPTAPAPGGGGGPGDGGGTDGDGDETPGGGVPSPPSPPPSDEPSAEPTEADPSPGT